MTVTNQIIFGPGDGMCEGDNYLKRENKNNWLIRKYYNKYTPGLHMDLCCSDEG